MWWRAERRACFPCGWWEMKTRSTMVMQPSGKRRGRGSSAYAAAIRDVGDMGLGCSNGDPQGEGRLGTTGNAHGPTGDGPGLLERGEDAHGAGYLVDRWRDGYCSCSDPTADLFRSSEKASMSCGFLQGRAIRRRVRMGGGAEADAVGEVESGCDDRGEGGSNTPAWI